MGLTTAPVSEQTQQDTAEHPIHKAIREGTPGPTIPDGRYVLGFIYDDERNAPISCARFCPGEDQEDINVALRAMRFFLADLVR